MRQLHHSPAKADDVTILAFCNWLSAKVSGIIDKVS